MSNEELDYLKAETCKIQGNFSEVSVCQEHQNWLYETMFLIGLIFIELTA